MLPKIIASTRYMMILAVLGTFIGSLVLLLVDMVNTVQAVIHVIENASTISEASKEIALEFIKITDLFLLSIVLYVISLGLYELFINDNLPVPKWAEMHSLEDLKQVLLIGVIVVLAVMFLSYAEAWDKSINILYLGLAISAVIFSLTYFLSKNVRHSRGLSSESKSGNSDTEKEE